MRAVIPLMCNKIRRFQTRAIQICITTKAQNSIKFPFEENINISFHRPEREIIKGAVNCYFYFDALIFESQY